MSVVTIRPVAEGDFDRWKELWEGYLVFYQAEVDRENMPVLFQRLLRPDTDPNGMVACDEAGRIVGFTHYMFHPTCWTVRDKCYLQDLFVEPGFRGGGAGRALIEAVYEKAKEADASELYWMTQEFNSLARVLYDKVADKTPFIKYKRAL